MSSNVYHKQTNQHRTRRDRVVVIDGSAKKTTPRGDSDAKAEEISQQRSIKVFLIVVAFMAAFLFFSLKVLNFLWQQRDESALRVVPPEPKDSTPAVLSPSIPSPIPNVPAVTTTPIGAATKSEPTPTAVKDVEKIYRWGKVLEDAGEFDGALARYREALEVDPNNVVVLSQIGRLTIKLGKYSEAVRALQKAIETSADNPDIMNDLGVALTFNGQPQDAVTLYDRLLKDFPDYQAALFNKGYALVQVRDYQAARPLLEEYVSKKPDDAMALGVLAVLELAEKQPEKALALLDKAIEVSPSWGMPYLDAAAICASMSLPERAMTYLDRALEFAPPTDVYRQFQSEAFKSIRITEAGVAFEKKIAAKAREQMK